MFGYCTEELEVHYEALTRKRARDRKTFATDVRAAVNADKKGFKKYTKHLEDMWRNIEKTAGRSLSSPEGFFAGLNKVGSKTKAKKG